MHELKKLKEETMKCNIIAQRMAFQEYCKNLYEEINIEVDAIIQNEEEAKTIYRPEVEGMINKWFGNFHLS
jgi:hypothetical protein